MLVGHLRYFSTIQYNTTVKLTAYNEYYGYYFSTIQYNTTVKQGTTRQSLELYFSTIQYNTTVKHTRREAIS